MFVGHIIIVYVDQSFENIFIPLEYGGNVSVEDVKEAFSEAVSDMVSHLNGDDIGFVQFGDKFIKVSQIRNIKVIDVQKQDQKKEEAK